VIRPAEAIAVSFASPREAEQLSVTVERWWRQRVRASVSHTHVVGNAREHIKVQTAKT
jgi:hypothetical protein